jgi:putative transcriptional regulator
MACRFLEREGIRPLPSADLVPSSQHFMGSIPFDLDPPNPREPARGTLLVSGPYLPDPYFHRSVILLCTHDDEGSLGFVLNRPIDTGVGTLMESMPDIGSPVGIGGPVQSDNLFFLHTLGKRIEGGIPVMKGLQMNGDFDQLRDLLRREPALAMQVRFFIGYSGWGEEQLAKEIEEKAWLVHPADLRRVMRDNGANLWADTLRDMGPAYAPLANFPEDPTLN